MEEQALRAHQRRTLAADALIASSYLAGTNTRRVRRAFAALFGGTVAKDTVSRTWRKVKGDWDPWNSRSLAAEPIVRLILDGTIVRVRLDRKVKGPRYGCAGERVSDALGLAISVDHRVTLRHRAYPLPRS
jgi:transposase-like protein